jgi:hypothetical protein
MSNNLKQSKNTLNRMLADSQANLLKSKNDLDRALIISQLLTLLDQEILAWNTLVVSEKEKGGTGTQNLVNNAIVHISECIDLQEKFKPYMKDFRPGAIQLLSIHRRKGEYSDKVAYIDYEPQLTK